MYHSGPVVSGASVIYVPTSPEDYSLIPLKTNEAGAVWSPCFKTTDEMFMVFLGCAPSTTIGYLKINYTHEFTVRTGFLGIVTTVAADPSTAEIE